MREKEKKKETKMSHLLCQFLLYLFVSIFVTVVRSTNNNQSLQTHPCLRPCAINGTAMTCYYRFEVEKYFVRSKACYNCPAELNDCFREDCIPADGYPRILTVINRKMPGTDVQVCLGDTAVVDVINAMNDEATSVHWHGHHQLRTPYMDGVPHITQCPIAPGTVFQYKFKAESPGTHFYHSHTGTQRGDGLFGALIIRQPKSKDIHSDLYDFDLPEHVMIITDWMHESGAIKYASHYHSIGTNKPDTILVNGLKSSEFRAKNGSLYFTPMASFEVTQGKRYRFRVINAGVLYCPIEISIENHTLIVINSDGGDFHPVYADSLVTYAGERWDFIVNANNNVSNYWIKFKGLKDCDQNYNSAHSLAVLHYEGAANKVPESVVTYMNMTSPGLQVNPVNVGSGNANSKTVAELSSVKVWKDPALKNESDISIILSFDFYPIDNDLFHKNGLYGVHQVPKEHRRYIPQINHISMKMPSFPVLSEPEYITPETFCHENETINCKENFCYCTYIIELPLDAVVEITFIDEGMPYESNHPFHLHGHSFRVVALERLGNNTTLEEFYKFRDANKIVRNLNDPPIKDTITVPDGGFTIIRFYTTNPGFWLLHCHLDFHVEAGMAVLLKVGEVKDFPPVPRNFPRCGNFYHYEHTTESNDSTDLSSADDSENEYNSYEHHYFLPEIFSINKATLSTIGEFLWLPIFLFFIRILI